MQLGTFRHPEEAARAYDCMAVQHYGAYGILNFEEDRAWAHNLAPEGMRIATRAEEKEHRRAERDLARRKREEDDPMVRALRENPAVMALQRQYFGEESSTTSQPGPSTRSDGTGSSSAPQPPDSLVHWLELEAESNAENLEFYWSD